MRRTAPWPSALSGLLAAACVAGVCPASPSDASTSGERQGPVQQLRLAAPPAPPCVAVPATGVRIVIAMAEIDRLVAARPAQWTTEAERLALIDGDRARLLRTAAADSPGSAGCRVAAIGSGDDAIYLVGKLLRSKRAAVVDARTGRAVQRIEVRVDDCSGCPIASESFHLPGVQRPFLFYVTKVT